MKNSRIIKFGFVISCVVLLGTQLGFCADTFQNNLLKADISKSPVGGLKITLFTSKPYNDSVVVNKKSDFEYVILMPETSNSLTAQPSLKLVDDVVKGVEVKTQQYANQVKGYTKIVVSTNKPIEIISHVQAVASSDYKLGENDYKQLLAQAKSALNKKETAKSVAVSTKKTSPKAVSNPVTVKAQDITKKAKEIAKSVEQKVSQKSVQTPIQKSVSNVVSKETSNVASSVAIAPSVKKVEQSKLEESSANSVKTNQEVESNNVANSGVEETSAENQVSENKTEVVSTNTIMKSKFVDINNYKALINQYFYALIGAFFALFLLLLLAAKKVGKNSAKQKENFTTHLEEKPETVINYEDKIEDDMTWQEKFQTYVDTTQAQQEPTESDPQRFDIEENSDLDDLFADELIPDSALDEDVEGLFSEYENPQSQADEAVEGVASQNSEDLAEVAEESYKNASLDELFGGDDIEENLEENVEYPEESTIEESFFATEFEDIQGEDLEAVFGGDEEEEFEDVEEEQDDSVVKSEFAIDNEKGFYLVDFENTTALVGHIDEEIFVLKRFDVRVSAPITARLNERKSIGASYMVKVAGYRALVDVTPNAMSLLIEL